MQMPGNSFYFIAIIPPDVICWEVTAFKEDIALQYNSKKALRVVPHITLKAPFTINSGRDAEVQDWFISLSTKNIGFNVELNSFGCFDHPKNPVIFVKPQLTTELISLQKEIIEAFERHFPDLTLQFTEKNFHPHMTIAYRDLAYSEFNKAWALYSKKEYHAKFNAQHFFLLKHNGLEWEIVAKNTI